MKYETAFTFTANFEDGSKTVIFEIVESGPVGIEAAKSNRITVINIENDGETEEKIVWYFEKYTDAKTVYKEIVSEIFDITDD